MVVLSSNDAETEGVEFSLAPGRNSLRAGASQTEATQLKTLAVNTLLSTTTSSGLPRTHFSWLLSYTEMYPVKSKGFDKSWLDVVYMDVIQSLSSFSQSDVLWNISFVFVSSVCHIFLWHLFWLGCVDYLKLILNEFLSYLKNRLWVNWWISRTVDQSSYVLEPNQPTEVSIFQTFRRLLHWHVSVMHRDNLMIFRNFWWVKKYFYFLSTARWKEAQATSVQLVKFYKAYSLCAYWFCVWVLFISY